MSVDTSLSQVTAWWSTKSTRDQWLLASAASLLAIVTWWTLVWSPLQTARGDTITRIARIESTRSMLSALPAEVGLPSARGDHASNLREIVSATASARKLPIQRIEQSANRVVVEFETADFTQMMSWLETLSRDHSIRVIDAEISRRPEPGTVSAQMTLEAL
jgi:general secretion pathway protein M|tara:strand:- start:37433 stop:37918 length:486 start_codon:yes stop_codon:yes gene_type:complete